MKPRPEADASQADLDDSSIEDLMDDLGRDNHSNADDDRVTDNPGEDDEPTEDLLAPELLFPSGSAEEADKDD